MRATQKKAVDTMYVVKCINDDLYWNNKIGWTEKKYATKFTKIEIVYFHLPIEGMWEKLDDCDLY